MGTLRVSAPMTSSATNAVWIMRVLSGRDVGQVVNGACACVRRGLADCEPDGRLKVSDGLTCALRCGAVCGLQRAARPRVQLARTRSGERCPYVQDKRVLVAKDRAVKRSALRAGRPDV